MKMDNRKSNVCESHLQASHDSCQKSSYKDGDSKVCSLRMELAEADALLTAVNGKLSKSHLDLSFSGQSDCD